MTKIFGRKIKETTLGIYSIKATARSSFTLLPLSWRKKTYCTFLCQNNELISVNRKQQKQLLIVVVQNSDSEINPQNYTDETPVTESFFRKVVVLQLIIFYKKDSIWGIFLNILLNFPEKLCFQRFMGDCFWNSWKRLVQRW